MPPKVKHLGTVIDGRIRKAWPSTAPGGPIRAAHSRTKGLHNPGLLCYRNAVLQCLLHIPEFFNYLCVRDRCRTPGDNCVFCALRSLALRYWSGTDPRFFETALDNLNIAMDQHRGLNPGDNAQIYTFLRPEESSEFDEDDIGGSGQQDAHEYFVGIYNMLKHINNHDIHRVRNLDGSLGPAVTNIAMHRLFQMKVKKKWTCDDCGSVTVRRERSAGIELSLRHFRDPAHRRVKNHLQSHFAPETLSGVRCDSLQCNGNAADRSRISTIAVAPEILVIQLVRMRFNPARGTSTKILDPVKADELLNLRNFTERDDEYLAYQLKGVVFHQGTTLSSGHYIAKVKRQTEGGFSVADDSQVDPTTQSRNFQSYILMYQKVGGKMAKCI